VAEFERRIPISNSTDCAFSSINQSLVVDAAVHVSQAAEPAEIY
jgi:hypothetical protein